MWSGVGVSDGSLWEEWVQQLKSTTLRQSGWALKSWQDVKLPQQTNTLKKAKRSSGLVECIPRDT